MNTLLYAEEYENEFAEYLLRRSDINLVLLRFRQSLKFSKIHLAATARLPMFVFDRKEPLASECQKFRDFCHEHDLIIDYFYNDSEYNQEPVQGFARELHLNGALTEKQARTVRDKAVMKDFLNGAGYKTADYAEVRALLDVEAFAERHSGYPIIIKWRSGMSAKEVYKVESSASLRQMELDYLSGRYIVETFCPDKIWCIDAIIFEGEPVAVFPAWLPFTNLEFANSKKHFAQMTSDPYSCAMRFDLERFVSGIASPLGLLNGYLHLEAFIDQYGQPTVCEFAWRTPGDHMLSNHGEAYGVDAFGMLADAITGRKPSLAPSRPPQCVGDMFLPMKRGTVTAITPYEDLSGFAGVLRGSVTYSAGDRMEPRAQYNDCAGWLQIQGPDISTLMSRMTHIYQCFKLCVEEDR